jgi:hypothetical protein
LEVLGVDERITLRYVFKKMFLWVCEQIRLRTILIGGICDQLMKLRVRLKSGYVLTRLATVSF